MGGIVGGGKNMPGGNIIGGEFGSGGGGGYPYPGGIIMRAELGSDGGGGMPGGEEPGGTRETDWG